MDPARKAGDYLRNAMLRPWNMAALALLAGLVPTRSAAAAETTAALESSPRVDPPRPIPPELARSWSPRSEQVRRDPILGRALPRWYGTSLTAGGVLSGAVAWATTLAQIGLARCQVPAAHDVGVTSCSESEATLGALGNLAHIGAWRGASVGARMVGHSDAFAFVDGTDRKRNAAAYIGSGATMFALGLGSWLGATSFVDPRACTDVGSCTQMRRTELAVLQLGNSLISGGGGLLAYGIAYARADRRLRRGGLIGHLRITPELTATYSGLSIGGRF